VGLLLAGLVIFSAASDIAGVVSATPLPIHKKSQQDRVSVCRKYLKIAALTALGAVSVAASCGGAYVLFVRGREASCHEGGIRWLLSPEGQSALGALSLMGGIAFNWNEFSLGAYRGRQERETRERYDERVNNAFNLSEASRRALGFNKPLFEITTGELCQVFCQKKEAYRNAQDIEDGKRLRVSRALDAAYKCLKAVLQTTGRWNGEVEQSFPPCVSVASAAGGSGQSDFSLELLRGGGIELLPAGVLSSVIPSVDTPDGEPDAGEVARASVQPRVRLPRNPQFLEEQAERELQQIRHDLAARREQERLMQVIYGPRSQWPAYLLMP